MSRKIEFTINKKQTVFLMATLMFEVVLFSIGRADTQSSVTYLTPDNPVSDE